MMMSERVAFSCTIMDSIPFVESRQRRRACFMNVAKSSDLKLHSWSLGEHHFMVEYSHRQSARSCQDHDVFSHRYSLSIVGHREVNN